MLTRKLKRAVAGKQKALKAYNDLCELEEPATIDKWTRMQILAQKERGEALGIYTIATKKGQLSLFILEVDYHNHCIASSYHEGNHCQHWIFKEQEKQT